MSESALRVVELSSPFTRFAGRLLVGLGFDVVLVEPPEGDATRREGSGDAFVHWHAGKRSVSVDTGTGTGTAELRRLLEGADILLDGTPDGAETLADGLDHLVHVRVTPFGLVGPRTHWQGTDLVVAALGGMLAQVGDPDGPPLRLPESQAEQLAGVNAAIAALLGMRARRTGAGQLVDVSAQACVAAALEAGALAYLHEDRVPPRPGRVHPLVPHGLFRAADGYLGGGLGGSPRMWDALLAWLVEEGAEADLAEPRWQDPAERKRHQEHVFKVVQDFVGRWPKAEFAERAQARKLPWAAVDLPHELPDNPQLAARAFFTRVRTPEGERTDLGFPFAFPEGRRIQELETAGLDADRHLLDERRPAPTTSVAQDPIRPAPDGIRALDGIRVLDLTWVLAGPYCTKILADHGAEVIKVESAGRPDPTRFAPFMHLSRDGHKDPNTNGYFNEVNRNKRSIALDTRTEEGVAVLRDLIAHSDVLVENFSSTVMKKLGLGYEELRRINPDIVYVSMSGMGHTGPRNGWVSYADTVSASGGLTGLTGWGPDDVVGVIYGHGDIVAGLQAALATVAALEHRDTTGRGQHIDLSQLEAIAAHMGTSLLGGPEVRPTGNSHPSWSPQGVYRCLGADRWLAVSVRDDTEWAALCEVIGRPELVTDERTRTAQARRQAGTLVDGALGQWARTMSADAAAELLQARGVPAGAVQDGRELVEHDPQLRARGFYVRREHPVAGAFLHEGVPIRLTRTPGGIRESAPVLGADTDEVLHEVAGLSRERIRGLREAGVLR
ncbi:crotonobetainyl-CoA:carnitine CoA-transferase CaiB-like acyl-CoA transferase [Streptomyces sp. LBL]|uniref:CaiB/BaiF CoA-transferase family protein n=1 Tax=Streptomyces sp. LBL TaxID=2940562 RepID=UPI00247528C3|nr:CoA transferase [Streptomyces sp. LBL]MDH6626195.1 crotonobetainyl-CoA:carnitine CoA-transferase CaiB-like acyl-CoA transferase [Streptomyces sp. LBL]